MGLLHILINFTYDSFKEFLNQLAHMIIIMFDIFHALTFTSLVGNGIKFVSSYQKYKIISVQINNNISEFTRLRQNMIFSGVLLVCFTIVFFIEVYLATFIQKINLNKCFSSHISIKENKNYVDEDEFNKFKIVHIILDFVVIILFILNIFDLDIQKDRNEQINQPINVNNFYLGEDTNQNNGNNNGNIQN